MRPKLEIAGALLAGAFLIASPLSAGVGLCATVDDVQVLEEANGSATAVRVSGVHDIGGPIDVIVVSLEVPGRIAAEVHVCGGPNIPTSFDETLPLPVLPKGSYQLETIVVACNSEDNRELCSVTPFEITVSPIPTMGRAGLAALAILLLWSARRRL